MQHPICVISLPLAPPHTETEEFGRLVASIESEVDVLRATKRGADEGKQTERGAESEWENALLKSAGLAKPLGYKHKVW